MKQVTILRPIPLEINFQNDKKMLEKEHLDRTMVVKSIGLVIENKPEQDYVSIPPCLEWTPGEYGSQSVLRCYRKSFQRRETCTFVNFHLSEYGNREAYCNEALLCCPFLRR